MHAPLPRLRSIAPFFCAFLIAGCSSDDSGAKGFALGPDPDGDGLPDALERALGSDPLDGNSPYPGGASDVDELDGPAGDGIPDGLEDYLIAVGTARPITASSDLDGDDIPDYLEVASGTAVDDSELPFQFGAADVRNEFGPPMDGIADGLERFLIKFGSIAPVTRTSDTDKDGLSDVIEVRTGSDPYDRRNPTFEGFTDVDGDGLPDYYELILVYDPYDGDQPVVNGGGDADGGVNGPDGDGVSDALEFALVDQGVAPPVTPRTDSDADGLPDVWEIASGSDPFDGGSPLTNGGADTIDGTGPAGDGISDALEAFLVRFGPSARIDASTDSDDDDIVDALEVRSGSSPFEASDPTPLREADVDGDGVTDALEVARGADPLDPDSPIAGGGDDDDAASGPAGDRLPDGIEGFLVAEGASAPVTAVTDTDADGAPDWLEVRRFFDPNDPDSPRMDGGADTENANGPAGDGISDALEDLLVALGTPAPVTAASDTDGDGLSDALEVRTGTSPYVALDPVPNAQIDVDGDGAPDYLELVAGTDPLDADDPVVDGASDLDGDRVRDGLEGVLALLGADQPVDPTTDTDADGLGDVHEIALGSDFLDASKPVAGGGDTDDSLGPAGDGISDALEFYLVASGAVAPVRRTTDQDEDGVPGFLEVQVGGLVFDVNSPVVAGGADADGDLVSDALETVLVELGAVGPIDALSDSDADGAPDYLEVRGGGLAFDADDPALDGAGDDDGDRIANGLEAVLLLLNATAPVVPRSDSDTDGTLDYLEVAIGGDPFDLDHPVVGGDQDSNDATGPAGDTLRDGLEQVLIDLGAAAPVGHGNDTDGDGAPDYMEVFAHAGFLDADDPVPGGFADSDGDSMSDAVEAVIVLLGGTAPIDIASDSDDDGAPDYFELAALASPVDANHPVAGGAGRSDRNDTLGPPGDGISDALEALLFQLGAPAPIGTASDADADGVPDYLEVQIGSGPFDPNDPSLGGGADTNDATGPPGDGISDALEALLIALGASGPITTATDSDDDGVADWVEVFEGSDPFDDRSLPDFGTQPRAMNIAIVGDLVVGMEVMGVYDYVDDEADPEGASTYQWYRDGILLAGQTSILYTLQGNDSEKLLSFEVTPRSDHAYPLSTSTGNAALGSLAVPELTFPVGTGGPGGVLKVDATSALEFWVRADLGTTIGLTGGVRPVVLWKDLSGKGRDATPSADEPELIDSTGPTGVAALRFNASALEVARPVQDDLTLMVVFSTGSQTENDNWWQSPAFFGGEVPGGSPDFHMGINGGFLTWVAQDDVLDQGLYAADSRPHLYALSREMLTGFVEQILDGESPGIVDTSAESTLDGPDVLQLGAATATGGFYTGDIFEMIAVSRVLTVTERRLIENYVDARYDIQLDDPLHSGQATHGEELAGIGRSNLLDFVSKAEGIGIVEFSNPSALSDGDYLVWETDLPRVFDRSSDVPAGYSNRWLRTWVVTLTDGGNGDGVGTVDVRFRLQGLELSSDPNDYALLLDTDFVFADAVVFTAGATYDAVLETISFAGVDFSGYTTFTLAMR